MHSHPLPTFALTPISVCLHFLAAAEFGTTAIISGKTCCLVRKRVLTHTLAGRPIWASAGQYAVTLTIAGPPPPGCACGVFRIFPGG